MPATFPDSQASAATLPRYEPLRQAALPEVSGIDQHVPLLDGRHVRYVNLDNAASTPPLRRVLRTIQDFVPYYSSVHRGTGFKSRLSSGVYEQARGIVAEFVNADPATHTVIFGKNATEAINKLAYRLDLPANAVVITTMLEHHSNDLPWRGRAELVRVGVTSDGRLDESEFDEKLAQYADRVAVVAVSGASNVTGFVQPIHRLARRAHAVGAKIFVDAAQLAPHRRVDMKPAHHAEHLDFIALSAHKMYAPFGTGALIGPKHVFRRGEPEYRGGGTVRVVSLDSVDWADLPDREEAGSPNTIGAVSMAVAAQCLMQTGMQTIADHERDLTNYALRQLRKVPGITIYTDPYPCDDRLGVIPFNLAGKHHALVAAILGYEGGIGVRSGCFCAHPYINQILQINPAQAAVWRERMLNNRKDLAPGMVRASLGLYNTRSDIDCLASMLHRIVRDEFQGRYQVDCETGEYHPIDGGPDWKAYFSLPHHAGGIESIEGPRCEQPICVKE